MTASFRKVDYSLRPAKHAERRMLCEIFRRLGRFQPVEDYIYVGPGSLWFSDFILFHRTLGIRKMISIDKGGPKNRFEANRPFNSVTLDLRPTSIALPKLDWSRRQFIWLDYDDQIDTEKLLDIRTTASRAASGTVIALSVQVDSARECDEAKGNPETSALERFKTRFGPERIAPDLLEDDLVSWRFGDLSRKMIVSEIESALSTRNAGRSTEERVNFHMICEINYSDGAKMTTVVGIFVSVSEEKELSNCKFDKLDFLPEKSKERLIRINVPKLTVREIRKLEQQIPRTSGSWELEGVPNKDADEFASLYRYLPNFGILES